MQNIDAAFDQYEVAWIVDFMEIQRPVNRDLAAFEKHYRKVNKIIAARIPIWSAAIEAARDAPFEDQDDPYGLGPHYDYYAEMAHDLASDQACDDYYHDSGDDYDPDFDDE